MMASSGPPGSWPGILPDVEKSLSLEKDSDGSVTPPQLSKKPQPSDEIEPVTKGKQSCLQRKRVPILPSEILER